MQEDLNVLTKTHATICDELPEYTSPKSYMSILIGLRQQIEGKGSSGERKCVLSEELVTGERMVV